MVLILEVAGPAPLESQEDDATKQIMLAGFKSEYTGQMKIVDPILQRLTAMWGQQLDEEGTEYDASYTALIGPSMSGKTRLIQELSRSVCTIYVCLRPAGSSGLPPRSLLADTLLDPRKFEKVTFYHRYVAFLAARFKEIADFYATKPKPTVK